VGGGKTSEAEEKTKRREVNGKPGNPTTQRLKEEW